MLRILKFTAAFLGVAVAIFLLVYLLNRSSFHTLFENREDLTEGSEWVEKTYSLAGLADYIHLHPDRVSIASRVVNHPDSTLMFEADTPRAMGTLSNFLLLIAYEDAFQRGEMDPSGRISWEDISRHQLPGLDHSVHDESRQFALRNEMMNGDNQDLISLEDALQLLVRFNGLALSDYLLKALHSANLRMDDLIGRLNLDRTEAPLPFSGLYTLLAPSVQGARADSLREKWQQASREEFEQAVWNHSSLFIDGPQRENWLQAMQQDRLGLTFREERDMLSLFPKTTAREMTQLLLQLYDDRLISESVSRSVKNYMRKPMEGQTAITRNFSDYGAFFDNRIGLLNGLDFGTSTYTGDTTVQAVFFDKLHIAVWFHMSSNHMHQDFQQRLIWDPALIKSMKN
ncbi:MAG: hypothetical protein WDZ36_05190 [Balneolaceae bacterium]